MSTADHPVLLFDGVCNLCNAGVQWVLVRDTKGVFRFAPLQSDIGRALLDQCGYAGDTLASVVLLWEGRAYTESEAVLKLVQLLGFPWSVLVVFGILPKGWRDSVYRWVARNRYRWFGEKAECMMPKPEWKGRFL